jgi:hypothetical protein
MPEMKNGINLIRMSPPDKLAEWKVVQYEVGKITIIYHSNYVYIRPMTIVLTDDKQSYWLEGTIAYKYINLHVNTAATGMDAPVLYIGIKEKIQDQIEESLKLCPVYPIENEPVEKKKTTRKRAKVLDTDQQTAVSTPLPG